MKKAMVLAVFLVIAPVVTTGCGAPLGMILVQILSVIQDAILIVDEIESVADSLDLPEDVKVEVRKAISTCRKTLSSIDALAAAGKALDDKDMKIAVAKFREAFNLVISLLKDYGVMLENDPKLAASNAKYIIKTPLLLK